MVPASATTESTAIAERHDFGGAERGDQRRQWDEAARSLRAWFPAFERFVAPVTPAMAAAACLRRGDRVVDVASGFGEPALTVARLVGPSGRVVATDLSPAMVAVAAGRARAARLTNVDVAVMDGQEPTLAPGRHEAVLCRLGLMFLPRLGTALVRLGRLLVPGGRLVAAVWGPRDANPGIAMALGTLTEFLELDPAPGPGGIFDLGCPGVLEEAFAHSGLDRVARIRVPLEFSWPSPVAFTTFHRSGPLRRLVAGEQPARRAEAWAQVTAAAARAFGGGPVRLAGEVVIVAGRRPPTGRGGAALGDAEAESRCGPEVVDGNGRAPQRARLARR